MKLNFHENNLIISFHAEKERESDNKKDSSSHAVQI